MLLGVISDTHIPARASFLPEVLRENFSDVDLILHAGDLVEEQVLSSLEKLAPVEAVAGNMDPACLQERLGNSKVLEYQGFRIGLIHGRGGPERTINYALNFFSSVDCVVFGHTHQPYCRRHGELLLFNPGSPTDKRHQARYSLGLLRLEEEIEGEIIHFE